MQKLMKMMHRNEKGFTLVELMVVVVIIGILVAIAIPIFNQVQANAARRAVEANLRTIDGAISQFMAERGTWPGDIDALVTNGYLIAAPIGPAGLPVGVYAIVTVAPTNARRAAVTITADQGAAFNSGAITAGTLPLTWPARP